MTFTLDLLATARTEVPGPQVFWMADWQTTHELCFQVALVRGDGVVALVNGGTVEDLSRHTEGDHGFFGEGARMTRRDGEFVVDQLARLGLAPEDVTHLLITPLTLYAAGNLRLYPNAEIAISKTGWLHFSVTKDHPHEERASMLPDELIAHLVTDAWPRLRLLEDEDEVVPGLRTWWTGGHHRSTLCVDVDTAEGLVSITDVVFVHGNLDRDRPIGICSNIEEWLAAAARLRASGATVLPLFDPGNFARFPGGVVSPRP